MKRLLEVIDNMEQLYAELLVAQSQYAGEVGRLCVELQWLYKDLTAYE